VLYRRSLLYLTLRCGAMALDDLVRGGDRVVRRRAPHPGNRAFSR